MATLPRVILAGGSGFLGSSLSRFLRERGYSVVILSRSPRTGEPGETWLSWDAKSTGDWAAALDGATALINLVGRSVDCRKTPENKRAILESRVDSCRALGHAMRMVAQPPSVWIQTSTAHIVGDPVPLGTICDETTPPGEGMAPEVGVAWESAFESSRLPSQRPVVLRISFVLGPGGGALHRLVTLTRWGLGGTVGSGAQYVSWIHHEDLNRVVLAAIKDPSYRGVYMTTAPNPVTNRTFMRAMRKAYHRPWSPPAPALAVRLAARWVMNTDPELALLGRRCVPNRLIQEHGFTFQHEELEGALADIAEV